MRRVTEYHEWAARRWDGMVGRSFSDHDDYLEGADAYAYRQASLRRALRVRCLHAWRYVPRWLSLGSVDEGESECGTEGMGKTAVGTASVGGGVGGVGSESERGHAPEGEARISMVFSVLDTLESFQSDGAVEDNV